MKYELHVKGNETLGFTFIEQVIKAAALGATLKPGEWPRLTFPFHAKMVLESDEEPEASPFMRVFDEDGKEIRITPLEAVKVEKADGTFSMEVDSAIAINEASGKRWTQAELEAMTWDEFKAVCKADGFGGRDRAKMQKTYLDKSDS